MFPLEEKLVQAFDYHNLNTHFLKWTLPAHLVLLFSFLLNILPSLNLILVIWILVGPIGVGVGFHRLLCHSSFRTYEFIEVMLVTLAHFAGQGPAISWCAVHLHHHKHSDTSKDLHSPINLGGLHAFIGWHIFKSEETARVPIMHVSKFLIQSPFHRWLHRNYYVLYWCIILVIFLFLSPSLAMAIVFAGLLYFYEINFIDLLCHTKRFGYRNFETTDNSSNNWVLGLLSGGVGFHNNHHMYPNNWFYQHRWFEFDLCGYLIYLIKK